MEGEGQLHQADHGGEDQDGVEGVLKLIMGGFDGRFSMIKLVCTLVINKSCV